MPSTQAMIAEAGEEFAMQRVAALERAIREMIQSVPGGDICDPQEVADTLRGIAERHEVKLEG